MPDINTSVRRFENGGILDLVESATTNTIKNIVAGSLRWMPSMRERITYKDRGVQQTPLPGDDTLSEIEVEVRIGSYAASTLYALLMTADATSGALQVFDSLIIRIPAGRGATTGETLTWSDVWLAEPPQWQAGAEIDTLRFKMQAKSGPVAATY